MDKIGGIWLDVDRRYYHVNNGTAAENYANINLQPGYQLLTGQQALDFVRYRHTDDDYHRIARQQQFVRALKQQFKQKFSFTQLPSLVSHDHAQRRGRRQAQRPRGARLDALRARAARRPLLPGPDRRDHRATAMTATAAVEHPGGAEPVHASRRPGVEGRERRGARREAEDEEGAGAAGRRRRACSCSTATASRARPRTRRSSSRRRATSPSCRPGTCRRTRRPRATSTRRSTTTRSRRARRPRRTQLSKLFVPVRRRAAAEGPEAARARPGRDAHRRRGGDVPQPAREPAAAAPGADARAAERPLRRHSTGLDLLKPYQRRVPFKLEAPTVLETSSYPDTCCGDVASRLYWIDQTPPREGGAPRLQDRRRRVLGDRGDEHAEPAGPRRPELHQDAQGPHVLRSTTRARSCTWSCCGCTTGATGS